MKRKILALYHKYEEMISYVFWGVVSMVVNIAAYQVSYDWLHLSNSVSTIIAWALAVIVAFITNKIWVFNSRNTTIAQTMKELVSFTGFRILSGLFDLGIMILAVDIMHWNALIWKVISNVIVVILNYIFSKFIIFKKSS